MVSVSWLSYLLAFFVANTSAPFMQIECSWADFHCGIVGVEAGSSAHGETAAKLLCTSSKDGVFIRSSVSGKYKTLNQLSILVSLFGSSPTRLQSNATFTCFFELSVLFVCCSVLEHRHRLWGRMMKVLGGNKVKSEGIDVDVCSGIFKVFLFAC